ncbi:putative exonuclease mut-7 -like protein [Trichinella murrelli]|uniref:Putative exonuclease mut-7-like protein n=1 Tax=Trichinella murrelli TaxID=144512 RepID=A0A0V0UC59_9BILA|nr:putative exonuclease mut-7 -like protein [Trichinella murrelli]
MTSAQETTDELQRLKISEIPKFLLDTFQSWTDPLVQLIDLLENISPYFTPGRSKRLHLIIIEKFQHWLEENCKVTSVSNDLLIRAFDIATACDIEHFYIMASIFQMESNNSIFVDSVRKLAHSGRYLDAVVCVNTLRLHSIFDVDEILVPCMFHINGNSTDVLQYLRSAPNLIKKFFQTFDRLLSSYFSMKQYAERVHIIGSNFTRKDRKSISKSVIFLAKHLDVDISKYKSFRFFSYCGALKFLCGLLYTNGDMNYNGWKELVEVVLQKYPESINFLIELLCETYCDQAEAAKWAEQYEVHPRNLFKCGNRRFLTSQRTFVNKTAVTSSQTKPKIGEFLQLPSFVKICFVDNYDTALNVLSEISKEDTIGIDSEWRPTMFINDFVSYDMRMNDIFQFNHNVKHLFKGSRCYSNSYSSTGHSLKSDLYCIFGNNDFSVAANVKSVEDISKQIYGMCGSHFNEAYDVFAKKYNLLSIKQLSDNFDIDTSASCSEGYGKMKLPKLGFTRSLNDHCFVYLGYWLSKSERMSDWQRRPLREMQIQYAALDAYAVIPICDRLEDFMKIAGEFMSNVENEHK